MLSWSSGNDSGKQIQRLAVQIPVSTRKKRCNLLLISIHAQWGFGGKGRVAGGYNKSGVTQ